MEDREFRARLVTLRIIWAAMLMGEVMFMIVILAVIRPTRAGDANLPRLLLFISIGMLLLLVPLGLFIRNMIYRGGRDADGVVSGSAYATGNIIFYAMCEGVAFMALVGTMLNGGAGAHLVVALTAMAVQVVTFPTGRAMRADDSIRPIHRHEDARS